MVRDWAARAPVRSSMSGMRIAASASPRSAISASASARAYLVFLDGDCIARPSFVAAHRRLAEPGWFVTGTRILMSQR